jgi:heat shock protein HslJ
MKIIKNLLALITIMLFCGVAGAVELLGHKWYLGILNQQALIMSDFPEQKPYLQFETDNTFTAYVGCNQIVGNYSLLDKNGVQLNAAIPAATDVQCAANFVTLENTFINSLPNVKVWEITNDVLYLKSDPKDVTSIAIFMPDEPY